MKERLLSKSLFVRALECPRKLYYAGKPVYADNSLNDDFLEALAEGGIQVGALARCYFPDGVSLAGLDAEAALIETAKLLKQDQITLFEGAIRHGSCIFRADILVKDGSRIDLIEVKAKSYDDDTPDEFLKKRERGVSKNWKPYLYDVAFQKHVLRLAFPGATINAFLMLADKRAIASVDGLNQRFVIVEEGGRKTVRLNGDCTPAGLGDPVLVKVPVDDALEVAFEGGSDTADRSFAEYVDWLASLYREDRKADGPVGTQCQSCEFHATPEQRLQGLKSGFCECWLEQRGLTEQDLEQPSVFDIWNFRGKADLMERGRFFLRDVTADDIGGGKTPKNTKPGLSPVERQRMQVEKVKSGDKTPFFDKDGFAREAAKWRFPLHFIDFETSVVAIPFNRGRHPYEGIAFQFSHHVVHKDGRIEHKGQYLNTRPGVFPNCDFLRTLKRELEGDAGTIFRYAAHENTCLNKIRRQLSEETAAEVPDRDELCEWVKSVTKSTADSTEPWEGTRNMVDMLELVLRYYYDPLTKGSNSIKAVLPAVLNSSEYLKQKYGKPIYGAKGGVPSLNFQNWSWIRLDTNGGIVDPYHLLPDISGGLTDEQLECASRANERLADGAAAMVAYQRLQFVEMPDQERKDIEAALLRYCELDTMAMVMIWEHWVSLMKA
jgi:hypothetical protein